MSAKRPDSKASIHQGHTESHFSFNGESVSPPSSQPSSGRFTPQREIPKENLLPSLTREERSLQDLEARIKNLKIASNVLHKHFYFCVQSLKHELLNRDKQNTELEAELGSMHDSLYDMKTDVDRIQCHLTALSSISPKLASNFSVSRRPITSISNPSLGISSLGLKSVVGMRNSIQRHRMEPQQLLRCSPRQYAQEEYTYDPAKYLPNHTYKDTNRGTYKDTYSPRDTRDTYSPRDTYLQTSRDNYIQIPRTERASRPQNELNPAFQKEESALYFEDSRNKGRSKGKKVMGFPKRGKELSKSPVLSRKQPFHH